VTNRTIYVSGPIAGKFNGNKEVFVAAQSYLSTLPGVVGVLIPHEIEPFAHAGECPPSYSHTEDHSAACWLRGDLIVMLQNCTEIWMLPDWEASVGARLELQVATACGMNVFFLRDELRVRWAQARPVVNRAYQLLVDAGLLVDAADRCDPASVCEREMHLTVGKTGHCGIIDCPNYEGNFPA